MKIMLVSRNRLYLEMLKKTIQNQDLGEVALLYNSRLIQTYVENYESKESLLIIVSVKIIQIEERVLVERLRRIRRPCRIIFAFEGSQEKSWIERNCPKAYLFDSGKQGLEDLILLIESIVAKKHKDHPLLEKNPLSYRQKEILQFLGKGFTYHQIGRELHLTERTVKYHIYRLIDILQVQNRTQVIIEATKNGWI